MSLNNSLAYAQKEMMTASSFDSLLITYESFLYTKNGKFLSFRSYVGLEVKVTFQQIIFDVSDSSLIIQGVSYNGNDKTNPFLSGVQLLVGSFAEKKEPGHILEASMNVRERFFVDESGHFNVKIKFFPTDILCFALSEGSDELGKVSIYQIGKLLD
jgi:hypothetical protein